MKICLKSPVTKKYIVYPRFSLLLPFFSPTSLYTVYQSLYIFKGREFGEVRTWFGCWQFGSLHEVRTSTRVEPRCRQSMNLRFSILERMKYSNFLTQKSLIFFKNRLWSPETLMRSLTMKPRMFWLNSMLRRNFLAPKCVNFLN